MSVRTSIQVPEGLKTKVDDLRENSSAKTQYEEIENLTKDLDVTFRQADSSDWPKIWPFWKQIVSAGETHPYPMDSTEEDAVALWLKPARSTIYVAEHRDAIVAAMMIKPLRYGNGDHIANFDLMVRPEFRGRGVGRKLALHVIEACRTSYEAMEAYAVVEVNDHAVKLWHGLGFQTIAIAPRAFRHPVNGMVGVHHMYKSLI